MEYALIAGFIGLIVYFIVRKKKHGAGGSFPREGGGKRER